MTATSSPQNHHPALWQSLFLTALLLAAGFTTACGSSGTPASTPPKLVGDTAVTLALSSNANDQLNQYFQDIEGITLTSQSGKTVTLFSQPAQQSNGFAEFIHSNGRLNPLVTLSVPQDVYTAATVTVGYAQFTCVSQSAGSLNTNTWSYQQVPSSNVTVTLPAPITVTGNSMGLLLNLQILQSASFGGTCASSFPPQFSITPAFTLTPMMLPSQSTNALNGKITDFHGQIEAVGADGSSLSLVLPFQEGARAISVVTGTQTSYQGVSGFSGLGNGAFVILDGTLQTDGSLLASRIAVEDGTAVNVLSGQVLQVAASVPVIDVYGIEYQGPNAADVLGGPYFNIPNATFQISGQLTNLASLPFVPSFNASNIVPGQNVYLGTGAFPVSGYATASTVTLIPQTINGTVVGSTSVGGFTEYTVSLASYDLFPTLAVQPGQNTLLSNPGQVQVYVDGNTELLNKQPLVSGGTFRFYGLIFNDNGTLRMDCSEVTDGVSFTPGASSAALVTGTSQVVRHQGSSVLPPMVSVTTRAH